MIFFLELVHWIGGDPLLFCDGLSWLGSLFMVAYLWLMEFWSYDFGVSLNSLMDSCEMLFGAMVYQ
jgi:hypothetical protein